MGKLKKQGNFSLPRIRKECAPEFKTLDEWSSRVKTRNSRGSKAVSPDDKRICEVSNKEIDSSADDNFNNFTQTYVSFDQ